ncbi:MAG TPA: TIGR02391 family protein [Candidatus Paceibacterota bacterium]|nr:TIGR02391 family protein [Candidatus Paceibacterota bacterium]
MSRTLAGIEYAGLPGISQACQEAVERLLQYDDRIIRVRIITFRNRHCLLLTVGEFDLVAIKSGFGSGYTGEGARRFSYILMLLEAHGVDNIEEYEVENVFIERLDNSALTQADIDKIDGMRQVPGRRWYNYVFEKHWEQRKNGTLWVEFRPVVPFAIIDSRIIDLALSFWERPDDKLLTAYRRLEDIVRAKTELKSEHGASLFSKAFQGDAAKLYWKEVDDKERDARASLFIAGYRTHRNPRAHREPKKYQTEDLSEFLLLNHLYLLERTSSVNKKG